MQLRILNQDFIPLEVVDTYKSIIWTDRYDLCGEFELCLDPLGVIAKTMQKDYYLELDHSEHLMIIEDFNTETDFDDGDLLIIKGRSLESILDRRVIWPQKVFDGNFQNQIETMLNEAIINPAIADRRIPNFVFKRSTDPNVTKLTFAGQFTGDNLYTVISEACRKAKCGFKILLNGNNQFEFQLYYGVDRSYDQYERPVVAFTPGFENLRKSTYKENNSPFKSIAIVAGEGEGAARKSIAVQASESKSGLLRRELYVDARDISTNTESGTNLTDAQYNDLLKERGVRDLNENFYIRSFEGEAETNSTFILNKDFYIGDIVHIANQYGKEAKSRVSEIIFSHDKDKLTIVPTFSSAEMNLTYQNAPIQTLVPNRPATSESLEEARKAIAKANKDIVTIVNDLKNLIVSVDVLYYVSTSATELKGGTWISQITGEIQNGFIWTKTKTVYKDGHTSETNPTCISSSKSGGGKQIKEIVEEYYDSTSKNSPVGGSWKTSLDGVDLTSPNITIWTRTKIKYVDGSESIVTPQSLNNIINTAVESSSKVDTLVTRANNGEFNGAPGPQGPQGAQGSPGEPGPAGPSAYVKIIPSNIKVGTCDLEAFLFVDGVLKTDGVTYHWKKDNEDIVLYNAKKITDVSITSTVYSCHCEWR